MPTKPLDLIICLKLHTLANDHWTYAQLADAVGMSASEANASVKRSLAAGLLTAPLAPKDKPKPNRRNLLEFIEHGIRYCYFASPGSMTRGMPTAHSAPPLDALLPQSDSQPLVWPDPKGKARGLGLNPLYKSANFAAREDPALYELLALVDAIRSGRIRERKLAMKLLTERLTEPNAV